MAIPAGNAAGIAGMFGQKWKAFYRRWFAKAPSSRSPESDVAWQERIFRYYATQLPFSSPLSLVKGNLTGETWEMRQAYREWSFREPAAKASLLTKCISVAQLTPQLIAANKRNKWDRESARWVDWSVGNSEDGWPGLIMNMLLPALIDGFSVNEKVWGHVEEHGEYHKRWTLKQAASLDTADIRFRLDVYRQVVGVQSVNGTQVGTELSPHDFIIFTHLKIFENPFGISDMRAAVRACKMIESAIRLRHILLTNYSGPFIAAKAGDASARAKLIKVMDDARANGWIVVPTGTELEIMNLATANLDVFRTTIEDYQQEIVRAIQGAYLQLLEGGISNGRGNTQVHNSVAQLFQWWLSVLVCQYINKQLIPDLVIPAYGYQSGFPRVTLEGIDEEAIGKSLEKFRRGHELGVTLSRQQVGDVGGFEEPVDESDKLEPPKPGFGQEAGPGGPDAQDPLAGMFSAGRGRSFVHVDSLPPAAGTGATELFSALPAATGALVMDGETLEFVEWRPWTNPRTGQSMWISEGGLVRREDPRKKAEEKEVLRSDAAREISHAIRNPERISEADVPKLAGHFRTLDAPTLKGIARSLHTKFDRTKASAAERILQYVRSGRQQSEAERATAARAERVATIGEEQRQILTHPALSHEHPGVRGQARRTVEALVRDVSQTAPDPATIRDNFASLRRTLDSLIAYHAARPPAPPPPPPPPPPPSADEIRSQIAPALTAAADQVGAHPAITHSTESRRREARRVYSRFLSQASAASSPQEVAQAAAGATRELDAIVARTARRPRGQAATPAAAAATPEIPPATVSAPGKATRPKNVRQTADALTPRVTRALFGRDLTGTDDDKTLLAAAANAADGARVDVYGSPGYANWEGARVKVSTNGEGYYATRTFSRDGDGNLYVHNDYFRITYVRNQSPPPPWVQQNEEVSGSMLLANQIKALRELGVKYIETSAARNDDENPNSAMNGYYTWPRLGYDATVPDREYSRLPQNLKQLIDSNPLGSTTPRSILNLMTTEEGRDWWEDHGGWLEAKFDLTPGSLSDRINTAYNNRTKEEKEAEKARKKARREARRNQSRR